MSFKAIIFDFDGVILESVHIKTVAFQRLFADYPHHQEQITRLHVENGGMSRFEKFKIIYRDFLHQPLTEAQSQQLGDRFSDLVMTEILRCPFVPGAEQFLQQVVVHYPLFIASGTPQEELRHIVQQRGLAHFFQDVYGTPETKADIIRQILQQHGWSPSEVVLIGDSVNDYQAAQETGLLFIGRRTELNNPAIDFPAAMLVVADLATLATRWEF